MCVFCVAACPVVKLKVCVPQMTMTVASVMHHVYRNSMDRGMELAWLIAAGVESDPSDITLHVTPIDFHWLFFSAEWHQYHRLTPLMKGRLRLSSNWTHDDAGYYFNAVAWSIDRHWHHWSTWWLRLCGVNVLPRCTSIWCSLTNFPP